MFISNDPQRDTTDVVSTGTDLGWYQQRIATLESELATSRANEEKSRAVLHEMQAELKSAQTRISQQQEKLKTLVTASRHHRPSPENDDTAPAAPSLSEPELGRLDHPYRKLIRQGKTTMPALPPTRQAITGTDSARWVDGFWKGLPEWARGAISAEDAAFLNALIEKTRPDHVYEIGVAVGASSALTLATMAPYADPFKVWLYSYDLAEQCYFDRARAVGDATRQMVPALLEHWRLATGATALDVARDRQPGSRPLYFIDANHLHPWPTLDLIALLPVLKPGDCVVLHDINLPTLSAGKFPDTGAQWLMDDWLGARLVPDVDLPNIGALFIHDEPRALLSSLVKTLARPWGQRLDTPAHQAHLRACERRLRDYLRLQNLQS